MRHNRLDLNLLVSLDALLEESSVSRAAERLFITQSAMSNALGRLRAHFGDDIVTRVGRRMVLTERGEQLRPEVRAILLRIQAMARPADDFDPLTARKDFRIGASDYFGMVVLPRLIEYLSRHAPHITIEVSPLTPRLFEDVQRGDLDLLVVPNHYTVEALSSEMLFEDDWCCVTWKRLRLGEQGIDLEKFLQLEHVAKRDNSPTFPSTIELDLERRDLRRRIVVRVPHYSQIPLMVIGTNRVALVQRRIAQMYQGWGLPLRLHACPFPSSTIEETMQWHPMRERDTSHQWLRSTVKLVCDSL